MSGDEPSESLDSENEPPESEDSDHRAKDPPLPRGQAIEPAIHDNLILERKGVEKFLDLKNAIMQFG